MRVLFFIFLAAFLAPQMAAGQNTGNKILSGTVLLAEKGTPDFKAILNALKTDWKIKTDSVSQADKTLVFSTPGATIMVAYLDYPVPTADIRAAATLNWLWKTAADEGSRHQAQVVISVITTPSRVLEAQKLFTKTAAAVLENTRSIGVYVEGQYLLLSKGFYASSAHNLRDNGTLPLYCWVYFGLLGEADGNSGYTYGMSEFGLPEIELVRSKNPLPDTHAVLYDVAGTIIQYNLQPKDGQKVTTLDNQEFTLQRSKAVFLEGETIKIQF